jgi:hypothetical protein
MLMDDVGNSLGNDGALAFATMLRTNNTLTSLMIGGAIHVRGGYAGLLLTSE